MAQAHLFRMVRLNDRFGSQVFTFLIPPSIAHDATMECHSKDFMYGNQKWSIMLSHNEKHLSAYLTLKNVSEGMRCTVDFGFTMLNQEHFTKNENFLERNVEFTRDRPTNGRRIFVPVTDILGRRFENEDNFILLECEIRAIRTHFEQVIQLPREGKETSTYRYPKFETNYFTFGNFEWNLSVYPFGDTPESEGRPLIYLTRQTSFGHSCRVQYRLILGYADRILETDVLEQVLDTSGGGKAYEVGQTLYSFAIQRVRLPIHMELLSVTAISEIQLDPCRRGKNKSHLYDRDKQAWMLETEIVNEKLKMKLYYADIHNVPRGFSRLMCWGITVMPLRGQGQIRRALRSPFIKYYVQDEPDEGYDIYTDITNSELLTPGNPYRDLENQKMTIHVEWVESHLLLMGKYHRLDETTARHKTHMTREIQALQAENLALEKQLYSYQQSIAKNNARGLDPGTPLAYSIHPLPLEPDRNITGVPGGPQGPGIPGPQGPTLPPNIPVAQGQRGQGQPYNTNSPSSMRRRDPQRSMSTEEAPYLPNERGPGDRGPQFQRSNSNQSIYSERGPGYNGRPPPFMRSASQERRAHLEKDGYPGDREMYIDTPPSQGHRGRDGYSERHRSSMTSQTAQPPAIQPQVIKPGGAANQPPLEPQPRDIADRLAQKGNDTSTSIKIEPLGDGHQRIHPKQKPQAKVEETLQTVSKSFVIPADDPYLSKAKKMLEKKTKEAAAGVMDPYSQKYDDDFNYPPNGHDPYLRDPYSKDPSRDYYSSRDPYPKDHDSYREARDSPVSGRSGHHSSGRSKDPYAKDREYSRSSSVGHDGDNGYSSRNGYRGHEGHTSKRSSSAEGYAEKEAGHRSSSQRDRYSSDRNMHHKNSQRNNYSSSKQKDHRNSYGERGQPHSKSNRDAPKHGLYDVHYNDAYQETYDSYDQNDVYIDRRHRDY